MGEVCNDHTPCCTGLCFSSFPVSTELSLISTTFFSNRFRLHRDRVISALATAADCVGAGVDPFPFSGAASVVPFWGVPSEVSATWAFSFAASTAGRGGISSTSSPVLRPIPSFVTGPRSFNSTYPAGNFFSIAIYNLANKVWTHGIYIRTQSDTTNLLSSMAKANV